MLDQIVFREWFRDEVDIAGNDTALAEDFSRISRHEYDSQARMRFQSTARQF